MTQNDRAEVSDAVTYGTLREANEARQVEWDAGNQITLAYRGNEFAGEAGEVCNVIKKLERERMGIAGSRDTVEHLAEELADAVICLDLIAMTAGIDLAAAVEAKFNATSKKVGLRTRYHRASNPAVQVTETELDARREKLSALREGHRRKMNAAADKAEMAASEGDMAEASINSTESERHREAFVALNVAIDIFDGLYSALSQSQPAPQGDSITDETGTWSDGGKSWDPAPQPDAEASGVEVRPGLARLERYTNKLRDDSERQYRSWHDNRVAEIKSETPPTEAGVDEPKPGGGQT